MTQNRIVRLKNKLIEDVTVIEQNKVIKQINLRNKIIYESPHDREMRELAEEIQRKYMKYCEELQKKLEKENEKIMKEILEDMNKDEGC